MFNRFFYMSVLCAAVWAGLLIPAWATVSDAPDVSSGSEVYPQQETQTERLVGALSPTLWLFAKQDDLYGDDGSGQDDEEEEGREPSWLELYLALGGIILVALGIVRLAESRRLDDPCFIASAAWGTPMAREVNVLRSWRDKYLLTSVAGAAFVDVYYRLSPALAEHINHSPLLAALVRLLLLPLLIITDSVLFPVAVILMALFLVTALAAIIWIRRRARTSY
ncbi:MAG TPA: hypothetical protein PLO53_06250 [Candidatus Hydrogenedentes bacterium]|nr:hypothetical protein [Candidatus Hydrogenedentota bacterium]HPU97543.1 hypothetical protein [Candidatus Hydrogenedentota bacterium]